MDKNSSLVPMHADAMTRTMKTTTLRSLALPVLRAATWLVPTVASASFVSLDFRAPGDGALTLDTDSGLEWLDVSYTDGVAFQSIEAGWDGLTTADGFAFPTRPKLDELMIHFGIQQSPDWVAANYPLTSSFRGFFGTTEIGKRHERLLRSWPAIPNRLRLPLRPQFVLRIGILRRSHHAGLRVW